MSEVSTHALTWHGGMHPPANPDYGDCYYNYAENRAYVWIGQWAVLTATDGVDVPAVPAREGYVIQEEP